VNAQIQSFEQSPPIVDKMYLQKLQMPTANKENLIIRIQYLPEPNLPASLDIFQNGTKAITLKDNGVYPDLVAGDLIYASYIEENIPSLINNFKDQENIVLAKGGFNKFKGHDGTFVKAGEIKFFNEAEFNSFSQIQIYQPILNVSDCENTILKQNSLFITDLAVVEDPARTFQMAYDPDGAGALPIIPEAGNPIGCWTFGTMIKNIANQNITNISTKKFIRTWLKTYTEQQSVGSLGTQGSITPTRLKIFLNLICPWIIKANNGNSPLVLPSLPIISGNSSSSLQTLNLWTNSDADPNGILLNWEYWWDQLDEASILKYAPFKLMAIVNRLDTRGNSAYNSGLQNTGETRFIFTLIDPTTGKPPIHDEIFFAGPSGAIDWVGMNVILEYGNPMKNNCALKTFAHQWFDLSAFTLGSDIYNQHLEDITIQVTNANAGGNRNFNRSAINQIRTNEKLFAFLEGFGNSVCFWQPPNWDLRQFDINEGDGLLHLVPVTNTPDINAASPLNWTYGSTGNSPNLIRVSESNYNLPENMLAGSAEISDEMTHFLNVDWTTLPLNIYDQNIYNTNLDSKDLMAKNIRHQLSINTCQGCHAGDTKTNFTMVMPRGYGEEAKYWDAIPSYETKLVAAGTTATLDDRFNSSSGSCSNGTLGTTFEKSTSLHLMNHDMNEKTTNTKNQIVSPFLTGNRYSSNGNHWQDDEIDDNTFEGFIGFSNISDEKLTGLYYVNDPSNASLTMPLNALIPGLMFGKGGTFPQEHTKRWGFNDLERRLIDLCSFLKTPCSSTNGGDNPTPLFSLFKAIGFVPLPSHSH
jgi:hypothetical protein